MPFSVEPHNPIYSPGNEELIGFALPLILGCAENCSIDSCLVNNARHITAQPGLELEEIPVASRAEQTVMNALRTSATGRACEPSVCSQRTMLRHCSDPVSCGIAPAGAGVPERNGEEDISRL